MSYSYAIEQAIRAAAVLHKDQVRKGQIPYPYSTHVFAVGMIVSDYTTDEDTIVAAFLHDTLEDTDYTVEELVEDFGGPVADIVSALTRPKPENSSIEAKQARHKEYLKRLKNAPEGALIVLAADKIHNMRSVVEEYLEEPARFIADFGSNLNHRLIHYQELSNVLNRQLDNPILAEFNSVFTEYKSFIHSVEEYTNAY